MRIRVLLVAVAAFCALVSSSPAPSRLLTLTIEDRIDAQRAIEEVYWRHRIWPEANRGSKPPLSAVMTDAALRGRVEDYSRKSNALAAVWGRPITSEQLQAEMERMARDTNAPDVLSELFAALGNDPALIAETLVRQKLIDRRLRDAYAYDDRFHGTLKRSAEQAIASAKTIAELKATGGHYQETTWRLADPAASAAARQARTDGARTIVTLDREDWDRRRRELAVKLDDRSTALSLARGRPMPRRVDTPGTPWRRLEDTVDSFAVTAVLSAGAEEVATATVTWPKVSFDAWWSQERSKHGTSLTEVPGNHAAVQPRGSACADDTWRNAFDANIPDTAGTAVWTGTEMLVWGGYEGALNLKTSGRYDPSTDTWSAMSTGAGVPSGRALHTAVWTGTEMIVWGGYVLPDNDIFYLTTGGRYDPSADTWAATSTGAGVPTGRDGHTAVWTGTEMIVWGGYDGNEPLNSGGRYDPSADTWATTAMSAGVPPARSWHTAVWTGTEMIVWGGNDSSDIMNSGGRYDPSADTWTATSTGAGVPSARANHTAVWTGTKMIVWGGIDFDGALNTGGRYDPSTDMWTETSTGPGVPSGRIGHTAVWTGTEMIIWGGNGNPFPTLNTGGRYDPSSDTWAATSTGAGVPPVRAYHTAVWTGTEMIVWGGFDDRYNLNSGGRYDPSTNTWTATSAGAGVPSARAYHTAEWTGTEMIVWGGNNGDPGYLNTGGRYDPATDTWAATSTGAGVPSARASHTSVWTGTELIVWGGGTGGAFSNTGGRYNPSTNTWASTSTGAGVPSGRWLHTTVWTGTEMIVWGGDNGSAYLATGSRYNPSTNTWAATSTATGVPSARLGHIAVWTGSTMIVWGGYSGVSLNTGSRYDPLTNTWAATSTGAGDPSISSATAVWTGTEMIVWGRPSDDYPPFGIGGRYDPSTNTWTATSMGAGVPSNRESHTAVWSGTEMIVWGGIGLYGDPDGDYPDNGGRYHPSTDTWSAVSPSAGVLSGRYSHTAVWTGREMIVWGGIPISSRGGRYCAGAGAGCTGSPALCDDGDACTSDVCDSTGVCMHTPLICLDDNVCNGYETCDPASGCVEGAPFHCDDFNACSGQETCDPATGCVSGTPVVCAPPDQCQLPGVCDPYTGTCSYGNQPDGTLCDDGNACTGSAGSPDFCDGAGACVGGAPPNMDDGNACTMDSCDPASGAVYILVECNDGNACNGVETCNPATGCVSGTPVVCAAPDQCHVAGVCNPGTGSCSYANQPNGTTCDDGNSSTSGDSCQGGVCIGGASCTPSNRPKTKGWYQHLCRHASHQGDSITDADAVCVGNLTDTFSGFTTRSQVCHVLDGDHDHHDDWSRNSCSKAEDQLMALALNICKQRVCEDQGIDSNCDDNGHEDTLTFNHNNNDHGDDDDDDHPGGSSTVGASLATADGLLDDPSRTSSECRVAECLAKEINNGHALEFASLVASREGANLRLRWLAPILEDGTATPSSYKVWRRASASTAPFVQIGSTAGLTYVDSSGGTSSWEYDVTAVLPPPQN